MGPPVTWVTVGKSRRSSEHEHFMCNTWEQGMHQIAGSEIESNHNILIHCGLL